MSLLKTILKKIEIDNDSKQYQKQMFTIVKYDISDACCTSQADNDFEMTIERLSYKETIRYLFKIILPKLQVSFNEDESFDDEDEDNQELLNILVNGFKKIMDKKRLSIFECNCGLDFFIFEDGKPIIIKNNQFNDETYYIDNYFDF